MKFLKRRRGRREPIDAAAELEAHQAEHEAFGESRGRPDLGGIAKPMPAGAKAGFVLLVMLLAGVLALIIWRAQVSRQAKVEKEEKVATEQIRSLRPLKLPEAPKPAPAPEPPQDKEGEQPPVDRLAHNSAAASRSAADRLGLGRSNEPPPIDPVLARQLRGSLTGPGKERQPAAKGTQTQEHRGEDSGPMADRLKPLKLTPSRASLVGNQDFLLMQGAFIDCGLQTKLVSDQQGMLSCYTTREVRSANGRVVLADPGTQFTGYQQGIIVHGKKRIGVVWSRMRTSEGVIINLDSPGTGSLGEAGLDGYIDTHFAERFGGAIMVSLIDDLGAWASNRGSGNGNSISFDSTGSAASDAVSAVLENSINIPPTLYRNQGGRVGIYVARDLDFSDVYELRPAKH